MRIIDKLKRLIQRQPPTTEQLAARAEAESELDKVKAQFVTEHNVTGTEIPPIP